MALLKTRHAPAPDARDVGGTDLLRVEQVAVSFTGDTDVLSDTSLRVDTGEFVTLLGPSGCGKSTLLNMTAGTLKPTRGEIFFGGQKITSVNRQVGYVTQEDTMLPWLSLAANIGLPLKMRKVAKSEIKDRVDELLANFGLDHAGHRYPAQLSGGMKKRGLLARAMIYKPRLLLMDEPFAALDAQMRAQLQTDLRAAVRDTGVAVLFVTHDLEEAALLSERVVVIGGSPGHIIDDIPIELGPDRDPETLRFDEGFREIGQVLHRSLQKARGITP